MIDISNVSKWYGSFQVLTDCTTKVEKGEVIVVCGPSGSGKSTLIKTVNALEPFQKGDIVVMCLNCRVTSRLTLRWADTFCSFFPTPWQFCILFLSWFVPVESSRSRNLLGRIFFRCARPCRYGAKALH